MTTPLKTSISVSIDLTDDFERLLFNYVVNKGNKSRFLKRLIYNDMAGIQTARETTITTHEEEAPTEIINAMKGFF